jgi:hypothetical protein
MTTLQYISGIITLLGTALAIFIAIRQMILDRRQRQQELRWKQAELAMKLMDEIFDFELSNNALEMLDYRIRRYRLDGPADHVEWVEISRDRVKIVLKEPDSHHNSADGGLILRSFDALLYYFARLENSIKNGLVNFEDIEQPFFYYAKMFQTNSDGLVEKYAGSINYDLAIRFLSRFKK